MRSSFSPWYEMMRPCADHTDLQKRLKCRTNNDDNETVQSFLITTSVSDSESRGHLEGVG